MDLISNEDGAEKLLFLGGKLPVNIQIQEYYNVGVHYQINQLTSDANLNN